MTFKDHSRTQNIVKDTTDITVDRSRMINYVPLFSIFVDFGKRLKNSRNELDMLSKVIDDQCFDRKHTILG